MTTDLSRQRAVVMGLGRFGGGLGAARWLVSQGADVLVTDLAREEELADALAELPEGVQTRLGEHRAADFAVADLVVVNPAVPRPWRQEILQTAQRHGVLVTSEIELLAERLPSRDRVIGVTGSAGKSTTATLIARGLRAAGETVFLGGNIGGSLLGELDQMTPESRVVLELSSAQLWWLARSAWSPGLAVVTNLAPNHLDWHGTFEHYEKAKNQIVADQRDGDAAVLPDDLAGWSTRRAPAVQLDGELRLLGAHNRVNAEAALTAIAAAAGPGALDRARPAVASFGGLPHRLQDAGESHGVRIVNDSKSTTPAAVVLACHAVGELSRVRLIAGGYDKGSDLGPIAELGPRLAGLYAIGATAGALGGRPCGTLEAAVQAAMADATPGEVVLLSPGCASWDQFSSFEERGERFLEYVFGTQTVDEPFGIR